MLDLAIELSRCQDAAMAATNFFTKFYADAGFGDTRHFRDLAF